MCDESATEPVYLISSTADPCKPVVEIRSVNGCPSRAPNPLNLFVREHKNLLATFLLVCGFALLFFGARMPSTTLFFSTTLFTAIVVSVAIYEYLLPSYSPLWMVWFVFYIGVGMGAGLGVGAVHWNRVGTTMIGAFYGVVLSIEFNCLLMDHDQMW